VVAIWREKIKREIFLKELRRKIATPFEQAQETSRDNSKPNVRAVDYA
jgi:hypothetical protein